MTSLHRHLRRMAAAAALSGIAVAAAACSSGTGQAARPAAKTTVTASATPARGTPTETPTPTPTATATATATPAPTPTSSGPAPCPTSELRVALGRGDGAAGSTYYPLDFTNASGDACTLFGYPGVSFVTGVGGSQIGNAASRNPAFASESVTVPAGGVVHAALQVVNAQNFPRADCHPVAAHWLRIYPPNQTAPLYLRFTAPACSARGGAVDILAVEAVRPGSS
jgi:hypothetical protein